MVIRRPPDNYIPPVVRGRMRQPRVVTFDEPKQGSLRRLLGLFLKPYIAIPLVFLAAIMIGGLGYYWVIFSARIDNLLKGEVFTRSAGIYAAPKQIRAGQNISQDDVIAYLRRAGYVERGQQAETARGRYAIDGAAVEVQPGTDALLDSARAFDPLRIQFTH